MKKMLRTLAIVLAALALVATSSAIADTVRLKDGTVLEGEIAREGSDFIFLIVQVGDIEHTRLVLRSDIASIERDDAADEPANDAAPATRDAARPGEERPESTPRAAPGAARIAFITLEGMVGPLMNAKALKESVERLEGCDVDVVVLRINSGGGALNEVEPLSNMIHETIKPKHRVVAWIESAISAAAMTAATCEEIVFMKQGNFGAAVAFVQQSGGRAQALEGQQLELVLELGKELSKRGRHDPLVLKAMQTGTDLSVDIDENGVAQWRNDLEGQYIVSTANVILTFNALDAVKYKFARGLADTKDELASVLGYEEWVEVCPEADRYMQTFRENVERAQIETQELLGKMQVALEAGQVSRARRFLGEIRGWVSRAPSLETYGSPPFTREWFRQVEEELRKRARQQAERRR